MDWKAQLDDLAEAALDSDAFGEAVTLADDSVIYGAFLLREDEVSPPWENVGAEVQLEAQVNPSLLIAEADGAALSKGSRVTVRSVAYMLAETPVADGLGTTRCVLMPVLDSDDDDANFSQRWR